LAIPYAGIYSPIHLGLNPKCIGVDKLINRRSACFDGELNNKVTDNESWQIRGSIEKRR
jgi:hypothetical protein